MSRKPGLRLIKSEVDLENLIKGDKVVINDPKVIPPMYVVAFVGRYGQFYNGFEFISRWGVNSVFLKAFHKQALIYTGDGSLGFKPGSITEIIGRIPGIREEEKDRYENFLNVLTKAGL